MLMGRRAWLAAAYCAAEAACYVRHLAREGELEAAPARRMPDNFPRHDFASWFSAEVLKEQAPGRMVSQASAHD